MLHMIGAVVAGYVAGWLIAAVFNDMESYDRGSGAAVAGIFSGISVMVLLWP